MNRTKIEWTDYTWNPITGCLGGCSYCYARKMAHRFGQSFVPTFHPERLEEPARLRKPSKIFVCSTSDLLGNGVPADWRLKVAGAMLGAPMHAYQLLTKRPDRYTEMLSRPNWWRGATATDQASWDRACAALRPISGIRWISAEPLLGRIELEDWVPDWVVIGLLSPVRPGPEGLWAGQLMEDLRASGVPVFVKSSVRGINCREWPEVLP